MADFTVSLLLPLYITDIALDNHWPFGWLLCKLSNGAVVLCLHANVFTLASISVDRCFSVVLPIWSQTTAACGWPTCSAWGCGWQLPSGVRHRSSSDNWCPGVTEYPLEGEGLALNMTDHGEDDDRAMPEQAKSLHDARYRALTLTNFLIGFLLPFLVITASCTIIGLRLRRDRLGAQQQQALQVEGRHHPGLPPVLGAIQHLLYPRPAAPPIRRRLAHGIPFSRGLACINSCINPFLYIFMWQDFRDLLKKSFQRVDNQGETMQTQLQEV
uniref:chemerin-like receptor 1 n=1 Tax=Pristiophorus japonicus TaxID=55135 RepID=UPI00398E475F